MADKPLSLFAYRDPEGDPQRLYTNTTSLVIGMGLYDNTGTLTTHKIGEISADGKSFDLYIVTDRDGGLVIETIDGSDDAGLVTDLTIVDTYDAEYIVD